MRVLLVNKFYDLRGGTERVLFDLEEGLRERGHEVAVFANRDPRNRPTPWARWFAPPRDYDHASLLQRVRFALATVYDRASRRALGRLLDEFRPDVAHLHNIYHQLSPSLLDELRERQVPVVLTLHDYKLACPVYRLFRDGRPCTRCLGTRTPVWCGVHGCSRDSRAESWLLSLESTIHRWRRSWERGVDRFVSPSRFLADLMIEHGLAADRLVVVPNAPRHVPAATGANGVDPRADRPTVLYVGRVSAEKGVDLLVEAARSVPEVEVRVAGEGPALEELRDRAQGLDHVRWLGRLDVDALDAERARAWAVAVPSVWYENAPLTVIEAQFAARPVLAAAHGGLLEMVEDGHTGWLVPPADRRAWAETLRRVVGARDELGRLGLAARERARVHHDYARFLDQHEDLYRRLAESAGDLAEPGRR